ncbi:MAG: hypothetical protein GWN00_39085, partial [Aliifodinibius sp.]|nr:hypothetical protein [Fodinibius sp.]NIY30571.1 hypothetical protein [Fodinibius sp.]
ADTEGIDFSVAATDLADGDQLRLEVQAGTTANGARTGALSLELVARYPG